MSKRSTKQGHVGLRVAKASIAALVVLASLILVGSATAMETPEPGFEVNSMVYPTVIKPGSKGIVIVQVYNTGAGSTNGTVTMTDKLPPGLEASSPGGAIEGFGYNFRETIEEYEYEDENVGESGVSGGYEQLRIWNCSG